MKFSKELLKIIAYLPYEKCTFTQILCQQVDIPPHQDGMYENKNNVKKVFKETPYGFNRQPEPAGIKVMISDTSVKSFYVCRTMKSKRMYIKIPSATNAFAINERCFFHGSKKPKSLKVILSTFGIVDEEKHRKLIKKSLEKYHEQAIWF